MFDSVMVPCPKCGKKTEFQSKSGPCNLDTFELDAAPADVMQDVNRHAPYTCAGCGTRFHVKFKIEVTRAFAVEFTGEDEDEIS